MQDIMKLAHYVSSLSTDPSTKVGCVIVDTKTQEVLSVGYNRMFNQDACVDFVQKNKNIKKYAYKHAEHDAIDKLNKNLKSQVDIYVTHPPCMMCSVNIFVNHGLNVNKLIYNKNNKGDKQFNERYLIVESNKLINTFTQLIELETDLKYPLNYSFKGTIDEYNQYQKIYSDSRETMYDKKIVLINNDGDLLTINELLRK